MRSPTKTLRVFLVASVVLHAMALAGMANTTDTAVHPVGNHLLHAEILAADKQRPQANVKKQTVVSGSRADQEAIDRTRAEQISRLPSPETHATENARNVNELLGIIQTDLSRHLRYPPLARAHGWEGTVLINLELQQDGGLRNIQVSRSSGFTVLDEEAARAMRMVKRIDLALNVPESRFLQVPVTYRLLER